MSNIRKRDVSISMHAANVYGILFILPVALMFMVYGWLWGFDVWRHARWMVSWIFVPIFVVGVVAHEWIHALAWMYFGRLPWTAIKFGFQWRTLTPFAHCTVPLEIVAYRWGGAMPGLVLGIVPCALSVLIGNADLLIFGLAFTLAAAGDALILWLLRNVARGQWVEDHPTRAGCYVLEGHHP